MRTSLAVMAVLLGAATLPALATGLDGGSGTGVTVTTPTLGLGAPPALTPAPPPLPVPRPDTPEPAARAEPARGVTLGTGTARPPGAGGGLIPPAAATTEPYAPALGTGTGMVGTNGALNGRIGIGGPTSP